MEEIIRAKLGQDGDQDDDDDYDDEDEVRSSQFTETGPEN